MQARDILYNKQPTFHGMTSVLSCVPRSSGERITTRFVRSHSPVIAIDTNVVVGLVFVVVFEIKRPSISFIEDEADQC